ncbi:hypothetical protein CK203_116643 [Vitis vinifera]|uniref:Uncharacterized protein n=1 Tax=Vitis vinifera TaxID=29760 RepID=A0A438FD77_VITVI|nr:hypothetical protein CK203_116643 [Vitis vinifera]
MEDSSTEFDGLENKSYVSDSTFTRSIGSSSSDQFDSTSHPGEASSIDTSRSASGSTTNLFPWMVTVAVSSTDKDFTYVIKLRDGANFMGESWNLIETIPPQASSLHPKAMQDISFPINPAIV